MCRGILQASILPLPFSFHRFSWTNIFLLWIASYGSYAYGPQVLVCILFGLVSLRLFVVYIHLQDQQTAPN